MWKKERRRDTSRVTSKFRTFLFGLFTLLLAASLQSQEKSYKIKNPNEKSKKCSKYLKVYRRLPKEIRYNVFIQNREIYFLIPGGRKFYDKIFDKKSDGIAIDVVSRDQVACGKPNSMNHTWSHRGFLMPPMSRKEMERAYSEDLFGNALVHYGSLPQQFDENNVETNLLVIQKKYRCGYNWNSNIPLSSWDLLKTGLYKDSITFDSTVHKELNLRSNINFEIPFHKNQSFFEKSQIKKLYDSLDLARYQIEEIEIHAFTSIEGTKSRNEKLQIDRANNVVKVIGSFQGHEIPSHVTAQENWLAFYNDSKNSEFSWLLKLPKEQIKEKIGNDDDLESRLEPILSKHRVAKVKMKLRKTVLTSVASQNDFKYYFNQNIEKQNIDEALRIQEIIFEKIKNRSLPEDFIDQLEVPEENLYGPILNNQAIFKYASNNDLKEQILAFEDLSKILPNNAKIVYNLVTLKTDQFSMTESLKDRKEISNLVRRLENLGFNRSLIERLKINFHILSAEVFNRQNDFRNKDRAIRSVYNLYRRGNYKDHDLLSIAKFLSTFSQFKTAESLLSSRVYQEGADIGLIDYYIRLTISNSRKVRQSRYLKLLKNYIEKDRNKFCKIFYPKSMGGYSFQVLFDTKLKEIYCENCEDLTRNLGYEN